MSTHIHPTGDHLFFTSDTHFGHQNILQYSQRPFKDTNEMDDTIIDNWNRVVGPDDTVYHLGDFAFGDISSIKKLVARLNGRIILIKGNHDRQPEKLQLVFHELHDQLTLVVAGQRVLLNHFPFLCYAGTYSGCRPTWQLFGHLHLTPHGTGADFERVAHCFPFQYDVGVDLNNYSPISWTTVRERILMQIKLNTNVSYWLNPEESLNTP